MTKRLHLLPRHRTVLVRMLQEHLPGVEVWAYGSRVNGRSHDGSDLDLVLRGPDLAEIPTHQLGDFEEALQESSIPFLVEARDWFCLPERFHGEIERDYVVVDVGESAATHVVESAGGQSLGMTDEAIIGQVPTDWEITTLGAVCERGGGNIQTGPFGSQLHASDYVSIGIPSVMPQNIGDNRIREDGIKRIKPNDAERLSRYLLREGDIVYSRRGDVERRALVRSYEAGWLCGTGCLRVRLGEREADPLYASYFLAHPRVREWIVRHAHGATMANLNTSILAACPFVVPPINEQQAIAHILGTLDDKIEVNRRMNATLEAMARAIFNDWFVDFGPTRAKMAGHRPYIDAEVWNLFPDTLDDEGKPEGWLRWSIYDFANVVYGAPFASKRFNTDGAGLPLIRIRDLATHEPRVFTEEVHPKGHLIQPGDIVVSMDGEFRLHIWKGPSAWLNQRVCHFEPLNEVPVAFLTEALKSPLEFFERGKVGTTVIHLGKGDIDTFRLLYPGDDLLAALSYVSGSLIEAMTRNALESRTLAQTRDLLLPKLMSGKIRVAEAAKTVEATT